MAVVYDMILDDTAVAAIAAATALCYRCVVSPSVRMLSRYAEEQTTPTRLCRASALVAGVAVLPAIPAFVREVPRAGALTWLVLFLLVLLTWRVATTDYDVSRPVPPQRRDRRLLVMLAIVAWFWSPLLLAWLAVACGRLRGWQHHAMMPMRLIKAYLAWFLVVAALPGEVVYRAGDFEVVAQDGLLVVLGCVSLSHYLKAAESKARLGPHWWSWAWYNRTHYLAASAYSWGWARFLRPQSASAVLRILAPLDRPLNIAAFAIELSAVFAFSHRWALVAVFASTALFNAVVALASGVCFWENVCVNTALAFVVAVWPHENFGLPAVLIALPLLWLSVVGRLWQPWPLGWWDTPFTARVHWEVRTASGRQFGLYNDFMCPYEREFGRVHGYFLTCEPIVHGHLGTVFDLSLRDALLEADADPAALSLLKRQKGQVHRDMSHEGRHLAYLRSMFAALNAGAPKGPVKRSFRWLKAPGGQLFYWGDLPRYRGEGPVDRVSIRYEERYYRPRTGEFLTLADRPLRSVDIPLTVEPTRSARAKDLH